MRRVLLFTALLAGLAACGDSNLQPLTFEVQLQVSRTLIAPGDTLVVVVNAQGGNLIGVQVSYGDGGTDQYPTDGARTAQVTFKHVYAVTGSYDVQATVTDATGGDKTASVAVNVQPQP